MKLQVFLRSFGLPILFVIFLVISFLIGMSTFSAFMHTALAFCLIMSRLLVDDRYVDTFVIRSGRVFITYYTQFLKLKSLECAVSDLNDVKLSRRMSIAAIWSPKLDFKADGDWFSFYIVDRQRYNEIQQQLSSVFEQKAGA
ncbi:MAG TPA: hypothetical protein VGB46_12770 [Flavisolibacter sp.]